MGCCVLEINGGVSYSAEVNRCHVYQHLTIDSFRSEVRDIVVFVRTAAGERHWIRLHGAHPEHRATLTKWRDEGRTLTYVRHASDGALIDDETQFHAAMAGEDFIL